MSRVRGQVVPFARRRKGLQGNRGFGPRKRQDLTPALALRPSSGFTLLEVLVALAVLALAMGALVLTASREAQSLGDERARTLAQWVAANAIAEARLSGPLPTSGRRSGEVSMGGQHWRWQLDIAMATDEGIRRLDVSVRRGDEQVPLLRLSGFAPAP